MTLKIAINGFGRIGRLVFRAMLEKEHTDIEVVAINDICPIDSALHLLHFDSVHGRLNMDVNAKKEGDQEFISFGGQKIAYVKCANPSDLPWSELGVDLVMECSGRFATRAACQAHLDAGAKRVLVSAPCKEADYTVVYGVNHRGVDDAHKVISNASCTTNCLAPVVQTLHKNFGLTSGYMLTVHAYTNDQRMVDSVHSDPRRARAGAVNIIPTSTGAASAIGLVLPEVAGRIEGSSVRVPVPNVSMVDLVCTLASSASVEDINSSMRTMAQGDLAGVLDYVDAPHVSSDFCHQQASSIFDATQTQKIGSSMFRVLAWYDNEWGFSNRMVDMANLLAARK